MSALLALCVLAAPPASLVGVVRVTGPGITSQVILKSDTLETLLEGDLAQELGRVQSAKVEVLGQKEAGRFVVQGYRIIDVGGGVAPIVGLLQREAGGFVLTDGTGAPVALSLPPVAQMRLAEQIGAKIWVVGEKLLSGQVKVTRYGILKPPQGAKRSQG